MIRRLNRAILLGIAGLMVHTAAAKPVTQYSIEEFLGTTDYRNVSFSHDGSRVLVSSDASGTYNVYSIPVAGGVPTQLTESTTNSTYAVSYFPQDDRFLYTADQGGNELNHLYVHGVDGGGRDLTPGENQKAWFAGWSGDKQSFFVMTNERDSKSFDVYEFNVGTFERTMLYENMESYSVGPISHDKRYIALAKAVTNADTDLYLYDRQSGETTLLTTEEEPVENEAEFFSPDGKYLYYLTNAGSEFNYLARYTMASGVVDRIVQADWDVSYSTVSETGEYMLVGINRDARTELRLYDFATRDRVALPEMEGDITSAKLSNDDTQLAMYVSSSTMPRDLFVGKVGEARPRQLTNSLNPAIDPADLVHGVVRRFASFDELEIPGVYFEPYQASAQDPVPALVWVHGGPGGQSRIGYSGLVQYLVNHGYAVYAINNRGSSGYGKTFYHLDDRKHGQDDLDDCVACKDWLAKMPVIDGERIGILGGSYGGYMTLAALTFRPEAFTAGVDLFGISNWYRTLNSIPPYWESFRASLEKEMGDFTDEAFLKGKSPIFHYQSINKPLMVLQGANDPRVLKVESDEIVEAVRAKGVPVEYVLFDDEGHGFQKKENRIKGYRAILNFLDTYLAREPVAGEAN